MADTAQARLERLLYMLPIAARGNGATLSELANALGVDQKTVFNDLQEAVERSDYHRAGSIQGFTISLSRTRVRVHAPHHFNRPMRLSQREALALSIGLRTLAAEAEAGERGRILELATRLEQELQSPTYPMRPLSENVEFETVAGAAKSMDHASSDDIEIELDDDELRGRIARVIEQAMSCVLTYVKSGAREPERRRVRPQALMYSSGQWYVIAHDNDRGEGRTFRVDRIVALDVDQTLQTEIASDDDRRRGATSGIDELRLPTVGYAFVPEDSSEAVRVRYSPRVARWVAERTGVQIDADGSLMLTHDVADANWIVRHVLQYGADAEVLEPESVRRLVRDAATKLAG